MPARAVAARVLAAGAAGAVEALEVGDVAGAWASGPGALARAQVRRNGAQVARNQRPSATGIGAQVGPEDAPAT